jgi:starch phosphorylase
MMKAQDEVCMSGTSARKWGSRSSVGFDDLRAIAGNLRWTWHAGARSLFARLDPTAGLATYEWPRQLLDALGRTAVEQLLAADPDLARLATAVVNDWARYEATRAERWFPTNHPENRHLEVAYFAAEFTLTDSLPIFAGGLGAIAGEQLKSASALGVPLVGVGLLYRETSHQWLDGDGMQHESWEVLDFDRLPVTPARDALGRHVQVAVPLPGRDVAVRVWTAPVGRSRLYLLDTFVGRNRPSDRTISARLYGGDLETRICQELVLGVGGVRALAALGHDPDVVHLNEGHTAFAVLERIRRVMARDGLSFAEAAVAAAPGIVFTTHTPVAAGHDYFPADLAARYLLPYARALGVDIETLSALGRYRPDDPNDAFCPTVLALRTAAFRNGVSRLHGAVTRDQWSGLWPRLPVREVPITHVTNGIHYQSWISKEIDELLDHQLGPQWRTTPGEVASWKRLLDADDQTLWTAKEQARRRLVDVTRGRCRDQLARRNAGAADLASTDTLLDPSTLTVGFVGRFVAYKRPTLLLRDPDRLERILTNPARPVQMVFAGKAHPDDERGKHLLREVIDFARRRGLEDRLVFLEDFDITMDRMLSQGVDVWLNMPRRPLEACGIGGMKAGANGSLNLSTLDGWWDEAWNDADPGAATIGWTIGSAELFDDFDAQDAIDAESLYDRLEHGVAPRFYERDDDGLPRAWLASMKQSMATLASTWHSHRMVREYVESCYLPGARRAKWLTVGGGARARDLASGIDRLRAAWPEVQVRVAASTVAPNGAVHAEIVAQLGSLDPSAVVVQLWVAPGDSAAFAVDARFVSCSAGIARYEAHAVMDHDVSEHPPTLVARLLPNHPLLTDHMVPGLITWSD